MLPAPVLSAFGESHTSEKSRLTGDGKSGYGSALSSEKTRHLHPEIHDGLDMAGESTEMQMQFHDGRSEPRYRRITAEVVCLPKERWYRRIRIPGIYNRSSPRSNAVHTTKYTILTFLPKNLWEQFHRFANIYFLFIALLNFVPEVEAFGKEVGYVPLLFVLTVTAIKDVFEDYRRYRSDREVNSKLCRVYDRSVIHVHVVVYTCMYVQLYVLCDCSIN